MCVYFRAFVERNPETQTNCVMLTLVPKFALNTAVSELIFVVDRYDTICCSIVYLRFLFKLTLHIFFFEYEIDQDQWMLNQ